MPKLIKSARGISSPIKANVKLEKIVKSMLGRDRELQKANLRINADVTKNEVSLSGTVDCRNLRAKAAELAKAAQVGIMVNNKIRVK